MRPGLRYAFLGITGPVILGILALGFLPGGLELKITRVKGEATLFEVLLKPGELFTIRYNHSVEDSPIWESHSADKKGNIFIEEEKYLKFGAGMGKMPGVGRMVTRGPFEVIEGMHLPVGDFILRIGSPGVDHTLIFRDTEINLSACAPHEAVQFKATPVSLAYSLYIKLLYPIRPEMHSCQE